MDNLISQIKSKSQLLFSKILEYKGIELTNNANLFLEHIDLFPNEDKISSSIIVIGINPSSGDLDRGDNPSPCYLHHIPNELVNQLEKEDVRTFKNWGSGKNHKKLCYPKYFGHIYPLFNETDYYPLFVSPDYNAKWLDEYEKLKYPPLGINDFQLIKKLERGSIDKFIIMQDLLPFKETKSGKIGDVFSVKEIQVLIIEVLELKFKIFKPELVIQHWAGINKELQLMLREISPENGFITTRFIPSRSKDSKFFKSELKSRINDVVGMKYSGPTLGSKWAHIP